ncbi:hypothetical protein F5B22DRAFT_591088 [Xylaria bambusicola]|uniref:uncharacterized protein n=1 Tax=Xylaria bambusicola TaxID=326684 RepID=UPI00200810EF|nr:uncharacterized protein F5B22DRAFT_591088 [Xylaria bambusicola]KAI0525692.1 hypothetical protein F5B22DRAFT_591088 [Xylaria bambusicola]
MTDLAPALSLLLTYATAVNRTSTRSSTSTSTRRLWTATGPLRLLYVPVPNVKGPMQLRASWTPGLGPRVPLAGVLTSAAGVRPSCQHLEWPWDGFADSASCPGVFNRLRQRTRGTGIALSTTCRRTRSLLAVIYLARVKPYPRPAPLSHSTS